jgi:antirestriction protein ArdC
MARDLFAEITNRIIFDMEQGVLPWSKPWKAGTTAAPALGMPINATTGKPYRGINVLLLWAAAASNGWADARFLTFKQAKDAGGNVRKGEHGHKIYFFRKIEVEDRNTEGETKEIAMLKEYTVFHVSQVEGCDKLQSAPVGVAELPQDTAELLATIGASLTHGGDRAFYAPLPDRIGMPWPQDFNSLNDYRATLYHELTHWTGHKARCDRTFGGRFGDKAYAREELVAELGGAFLCAEYGLPYQTQHASYLANWLEVLKEDKRAILQAASMAQKAVDFIRAAAIKAPVPLEEMAEAA